MLEIERRTGDGASCAEAYQSQDCGGGKGCYDEAYGGCGQDKYANCAPQVSEGCI
jgi:hypothetical protein